jgi:hypothetical protein
MSQTELATYETKVGPFFIPSFTSTSKSNPFHNKNTIIHIDLTPECSKYCMEITPQFTKYSHEEEILFSCYNLYHHERTEKSNGKRYMKLRLADYDRYYDYNTNIIRLKY